MPTLFRIGSYRVRMYTNDHEPAHIHVMGGGFEVLFYLNCPDGPLTERVNYGMPERTANDLRKQLRAYLRTLCIEWESMHDRT